MGASPSTAPRIWESVMRADPRDALLEQVVAPTLVLHRRDNLFATDDVVTLARERSPHATVVELEGRDHFPFVGDVDALIAEIAAFVVGERRLPPPQRLLSAVLFTDLVDSTARAAALGDEDWKSVLDRHDTAVRTIVGRSGGTVVKTTGDGVLALVPSAGVCLRAAAAVRRDLGAVGLDVRIGVHVGDIDRRGDDVSGLAVNIASRAMSIGGAGEIIVTVSVVAAVAGQAVAFEPLGTHDLKGVPGDMGTVPRPARPLNDTNANISAATPSDRSLLRFDPRAPPVIRCSRSDAGEVRSNSGADPQPWAGRGTLPRSCEPGYPPGVSAPHTPSWFAGGAFDSGRAVRTCCRGTSRKDTPMRRVVILLLAAGLVFAVAHPASAAPTSSDPKTAAADAAAWVASQVNGSGFIPRAADPTEPNLSVSVQAVTALAAAGVGKTTANALLAYLGAHVDDFVIRSGADSPGEISLLVLDAVALGQSPTSFGPSHVDLVSRLLATQQPSGLFGALDPTFDGAFRQGLSLMALHAVGMTNRCRCRVARRPAVRRRDVDAVPRRHCDAVPAGRPDQLHGSRHQLDRARVARPAGAGRDQHHGCRRDRAPRSAQQRERLGLPRRERPVDRRELDRSRAVGVARGERLARRARHHRAARAASRLRRRPGRPGRDRVPARGGRRARARRIRDGAGDARACRGRVAHGRSNDDGRRADTVRTGDDHDDRGRGFDVDQHDDDRDRIG